MGLGAGGAPASGGPDWAVRQPPSGRRWRQWRGEDVAEVCMGCTDTHAHTHICIEKKKKLKRKERKEKGKIGFQFLENFQSSPIDI